MIKSKNKQRLFNLKNKKNLIKNNSFLRYFFFVFVLLFLPLSLVFAQSLPPTDADIKVTAKIPDIIPPSTPILIIPEDQANLDNAYPVFQWHESTDNMEMSYYQFILDGKVWFDKIPLTDFANDDYSLDYNPESGIYTLVAKSALKHGPHSWQIIAYDYVENRAASTTWVFNIYVDDPNFTIQKIGDVSVKITASNPDSVPQTAIRLFLTDPYANEPWIIALGDANLKVDLVVTIPFRTSQFFSQYTDDKGNWNLQLGILPRNHIIRLDFNITDVVGHSSYIRNLYIIIQQHYWPATPMPTATITGAPLTGFPSVTTSPSITQPSVIPVSPLPPPGIKIPIIPPKEIIHEIVEEVKESLPTKMATYITDLTRSPLWKFLANFFALFLALLLPIITYILVLLKFYKFLSFKTLKKVLIALWPWSKRRKNLVFEYRNSQAASLVRVELLDLESKELLDWQITNYLGQFPSFDWPSDLPATLGVVDHNFYFPIGVDKPVYLSWYNFYQGEAFLCKKDYLTEEKSYINERIENFDAKRALAIPTLMAQGKENLPLIERIRIILSYLLSYPWWFFFLSLLVILPFVLRHPSLFNYLALVYYLTIALFKYFHVNGSEKWQFRALYSNGYKIDQNLILIMNDLAHGFSQALVVAMNDSLSSKLNLVKKDFVFSLQAKDYAFWDGQRVISELEYSLNQEAISEFKLHHIESFNQSLKLLQPHCQLLPRQ